MSANSSIQWTDATWNVVTGCTKVSPGCTNCYIASTPPFRIAGRKFVKGKIPLEFHEDRLELPLHWRKPRLVFVNSLSDLFHEDVPDEFIDRVFTVMALCPQHTFQVLTKRAERMLRYCSGASDGQLGVGILPNVWLGVSVEDQKRADERIPHLLQTPAAVRFLSCEPLLGPIDYLASWLVGCDDRHLRPRSESDRLAKRDQHLRSIDWVIAGGESGRGARPCDLAWIRSLRDQCRAAAVPWFLKQIGAKPYIDRSPEPAASLARKHGVGPLVAQFFEPSDAKGGNPDEWPEDLRADCRQFPAVAEGSRA